MNLLSKVKPGTMVCLHCGGTGVCQRSDVHTDHHHQWMECSVCGKGIPAIAGNDFGEELRRPVCGMCGGSGMVEPRRAKPAGAP